MEFGYIDHTAAVIDIIAAPALMAATLPIYSKWLRDMRGRKAIQLVAIGIVAVAFLLDAADRLGAFGPTRSSLTAENERLRVRGDRLHGEANYRRILLYGKDGKHGYVAEQAWILSGKDFVPERGTKFGGLRVHVVPNQPYVQLLEPPPAPGSACFKVRNAKLKITGKSSCKGVETGWDVGKGSDVESENPTVAK